jgi:hypothetical protein
MRPGSWEGGEEGISFLNVSYEFLPTATTAKYLRVCYQYFAVYRELTSNGDLKTLTEAVRQLRKVIPTSGCVDAGLLR